MPDKVNLAQKFSQIHEYWSPHIAGELNGQMVKLAKVKGEFVWHHHENEDEMFLGAKGRFRIEFRDNVDEGDTHNQSLADKSVRATRGVQLEPRAFVVVPPWAAHKP